MLPSNNPHFPRFEGDFCERKPCIASPCLRGTCVFANVSSLHSLSSVSDHDKPRPLTNKSSTKSKRDTVSGDYNKNDDGRSFEESYLAPEEKFKWFRQTSFEEDVSTAENWVETAEETTDHTLNSGKGRDSQTLTTASSEGNYLQVAQRMTENQAEFLKFELEEGDQMTRFESETDQELISELVEAKHKYSDEGELHVTTEKSGATTSPNLERKNQGHKILGSNNSLNGSDITQGRKDDYQFNPKNGSHVRQRGRSFDDFFNYPDGSQETYVDLEFLQAHGQSYEEPEVKFQIGSGSEYDAMFPPNSEAALDFISSGSGFADAANQNLSSIHSETSHCLCPAGFHGRFCEVQDEEREFPTNKFHSKCDCYSSMK